MLGDLGDPEAAEGVGAGCEGDDGGADAVWCFAEEGGAVAGVFADGVAEGGDAAFGGLEGERDGQAGVVAQAGGDGVAGGLLGRQDG